MRFLVVLAIAFAPMAMAQDGLRETDVKLNEIELTVLLSGQVIAFYNDSFATYLPDGEYLYNYSAEAAPVPGVYRVKDDGSVCTEFANGFSRCDFIVRAGERYVMIIANGDRYPIRTRTAIK